MPPLAGPLFVVTGDCLTAGGGVTHLVETFTAVAASGVQVHLFAPAIDVATAMVPHRVKAPGRGLVRALLFDCFLFWSLLVRTLTLHPACIYCRQISTSVVPALVARLCGVPYVLEVNGVLEDERGLAGASGLRLALVRWCTAVNLRLARRVSVTVAESRDRLRQLHRLPADRFVVLPCSAANHRRFRPGDAKEARARLGLPEEAFIVGFLGTLYPWHGLDLLLAGVPRLAAQVPETLVVVVGDGVERPRLEGLARELGIAGRVRFTGLVPYDAAPEWVRAFDVGVSFFKPTRPIPGIPMKMYEYMASGIPVLGSAVPGYGPVAEAAGAGLAVDANDPEAVADALVRLARDPATRRAMGAKGRAAIEERYTWDHHGQAVLALIREVAR